MAAASALLSSLLPLSARSELKALTLVAPRVACAASPRPACRLLYRGRDRTALLRRNVAMSSEVEEDEVEEEEGGGSVNQRYSDDLRIFVGNLPFTTDSAQLAGLFQQAGTVEMCEVIYDKFTGRSRGFGFVTMSTAEEAESAAQQFNGYELGGRLLRVSAGPPPPKDATPRRPPSQGFNDSPNRVYVGNLSWSVDDSALRNLFSEHGNVVDVRVVYDRETGRSRGFGFITYSSSDEVNSAVASLNGLEFDGRSLRVTPAEPRQRREF